MSKQDRQPEQREAADDLNEDASPYAINIDEGLLSEALAAVAPTRAPARGRPVPATLRGMPVAAAAPRRATTAEPAAKVAPPIAAPPTAAPRRSAPPKAAAPTAPAPPPEELETDEIGIDAGDGGGAELAALKTEIAQLRAERDEALTRVEHETRERLKLVARAKRLTDDITRLGAAATLAEDGRKQAEGQLALAREATRLGQEAIDRARERSRRAEAEYRQGSALPLLGDLLPIVDNLERALYSARGRPDMVLSGLQMIVDQFQAALIRIGVERIIAAQGSLFKPAVHEAVLYVASDDTAPGNIVSEMQSGYTWQGKLLRAARVSVAAPSEQAALSVDQVEARRARSALSEGELLVLPDEHSIPPREAEDDS